MISYVFASKSRDYNVQVTCSPWEREVVGSYPTLSWVTYLSNSLGSLGSITLCLLCFVCSSVEWVSWKKEIGVQHERVWLGFGTCNPHLPNIKTQAKKLTLHFCSCKKKKISLVVVSKQLKTLLVDDSSNSGTRCDQRGTKVILCTLSKLYGPCSRTADTRLRTFSTKLVHCKETTR